MTTVVTNSDVIGDNVKDLWEESVDAGMRITRIVEIVMGKKGQHKVVPSDLCKLHRVKKN